MTNKFSNGTEPCDFEQYLLNKRKIVVVLIIIIIIIIIIISINYNNYNKQTEV